MIPVITVISAKYISERIVTALNVIGCLLFSNGLQARIPVPIRIMSMIFIAAKGMMIPPAP